MTMTWSSTGANLTRVTDALSQSVQFNYDALNNLTQTLDARQVTTTYSYSGTLLTSLTQAGTSTSLYTYTTALDNVPPGLLKAMRDPTGHVIQYKYDTLGQLARITDTAGLVTTYGYDKLGRVITTTALASTAQEQVTVNDYDAAGRLLQVTRNYTSTSGDQNYVDNDSVYNLVTGYQYDAVGNQVAMTDTLGLVTQTEYDPDNRPVAITVTTAAGTVQDLARTLYDTNGNVISTTVHAHAPALALTTLTAYDALNRPVTVTTNYVDGLFDPGRPDEDLMSVTSYDAAGNVLAVTELYGTALARTSATGYDALNRPISATTNLTSTTGPDRNLTTLTRYDAGGNVISTTAYADLPSLAVTTLTGYDALNRPVTVTTAAGTPLALTSVTAYNAAGQVTSVTEAFGTSQAHTTRTEYDTSGRPMTVTTNYDGTGVAAPDRNLVQVTVYDAFGRRGALAERRVSPLGAVTWITATFSYNNLGQLIATTQPLTNGVSANTSQAYDALGRVIRQTDALGQRTVTEYDALGRPVTVTVNYVDGVSDPDVPDEDLLTVAVYDAAGQRVRVTDPNGVQTRYGYDLLGRLVLVVENDGQFQGQAPVTTTYTYDGAGNLRTISDGRGRVSTFTYDLLGRQLTASDPLTHTTVYTYNAAGRQTAMLDANGQVTINTNDVLGRLTAIDYPGSTPDVAFGYDVLGQRTVMTDGTGTTTWAYDLVGRPITVTQPGIGAPVVYGYDSAGNRTSLRYPDGQVVTYTYDLGARLVTVADWQALTTGYTYNNANQMETIARPNGITSTYGYDDAGRLLTIRHESALGVLGEYTYTLDAAGQRTAVSESLAPVYTQLLPLILYTEGEGEGLLGGDGGDGLALPTDDAPPAGGYPGPEDGALPELPPVEAPGEGYPGPNAPTAEPTAEPTLSPSPDATATPTSAPTPEADVTPTETPTLEPTPTASGTPAPTETDSSTPTPTGTPTFVAVRMRAGAGLARLALAAPNPRAFLVPHQQELSTTGIDYEYDALNRLTRADYDDGSYFAYAYDEAGNRTQEVACWGGTSCTPITTTYTYDAANRLDTVNGVTYVWDNNGNLRSDGTFSYTYDAANRLIAATNGVLTTTFTYNGLGDRISQTVAGVVTTYTLDLAAGLTQVLADGANTYLYGNGRIAEVSAANSEYYLGDGLGSVRQLAGSSGAVSLAQGYEPYGEVLTRVGGGVTSYGFTGEQFDASTGLLYLRARYYSGHLTQFIQPDPSVPLYFDPRTQNRYAYANTDPMNLTDPSGLRACTPGEALFEIVVSLGYWLFMPADPCTVAAPQLNAPVIATPSPWQAYPTSTATPQPIPTIPFDHTQIANLICTATAAAEAQASARATATATSTPARSPTPGLIVPLFRAIGPTELEYVLMFGNYGHSPSEGGKYFALTELGAREFAKKPLNQGRQMTVTSVTIPEYFMEQGFLYNDWGGAGPSVHFGEEHLENLYRVMSRIVILGPP